MHCAVLSAQQISQIHLASIAVLERIGVVVPHEDMLNRMEAAGARVNRAAQRALIPESLSWIACARPASVSQSTAAA